MLSDVETIELVERYVDTVRKHYRYNEAVSSALKLLCQDNEFVSSGDYLLDSYNITIKKLIGNYLMDWVDWWMYECEFGTKSMTYTITPPDCSLPSSSYDVSEQTFYQFYKIVSI